jgi:hypothetical protein
MGIGAQSLNFAKKNLSYAKAVARTQAGASFLRWGMVGAGAGAVYGMADNLTGNDRVSIVQGAVRGGMMGMGARGLFGGFKGLKPELGPMHGPANPFGAMHGPARGPRPGTPGNPINASNVRRIRTPLSLGSSQMEAGFTMRPGSSGMPGASPLLLTGSASQRMLSGSAAQLRLPYYKPMTAAARRNPASRAMNKDRMATYWSGLNKYHPTRPWEKLR